MDLGVDRFPDERRRELEGHLHTRHGGGESEALDEVLVGPPGVDVEVRFDAVTDPCPSVRAPRHKVSVRVRSHARIAGEGRRILDGERDEEVPAEGERPSPYRTRVDNSDPDDVAVGIILLLELDATRPGRGTESGEQLLPEERIVVLRDEVPAGVAGGCPHTGIRDCPPGEGAGGEHYDQEADGDEGAGR